MAYMLVAIGVIVAILLIVGIVLLAVFLSRKNSKENISQNGQNYQAPPDVQYQVPPENGGYASQYDVPKTGVGVGLGFLGLIGLIIGICMYPQGTTARTTFVKGWLITFLVSMAVEVVLVLVIYFSMFSFLMVP